MHLVGLGAVELVRSACQRTRRGCGAEAVAGRTIYDHTVLWHSPDDGLAAQPGLSRQSYTRTPVAADQGSGGDLCQAAAQPARGGPDDRPLSAARGDGEPGQSGVERGYHV